MVKALSLTQPWATLVALGAKQIETRSWYTSYRGPLVIHAAKAFPAEARDICNTEPFQEALHEVPRPLPLGAGLCLVELVACVETTKLFKLGVLGIKPMPQEIYFGNFSPGRWAFALKLIRVFEKPVERQGSLSIWDWGLTMP